MPSFTSAAVLAVLAFSAPLVLRALHLRLPEAAAEIVLGIAVGPQVLRWARVDGPVSVLSLIGLGFLLLLAGLEIDVRHLPRTVLALSSVAFGLSFVIAFGVGLLLRSTGLVRSAWLVALTLSATSLGVILPALEDAGQLKTRAGRLVLAGASLAEVVPVVLVHGVPVLLYARQVERRSQLVAVGLLQATSLSLPVVAGGIGVSLGLMTPATYAAFVAAGLVSVLAFPLLATRLLVGPRPPSPTAGGAVG